MKKYISILGITGICLFNSCSPSKVVVDQGKLVRGDWQVTNVSVSGINENYINADVLDEANFKCYQGSTWHLVQNNNSGTYTLNGGGDCPAVSNNIKWTISENSGTTYFNFKRTTGQKAKDVTSGYTFRITSSSDNNFTLSQDLNFEGKPIQILYQFSKLSN